MRVKNNATESGLDCTCERSEISAKPESDWLQTRSHPGGAQEYGCNSSGHVKYSGPRRPRIDQHQHALGGSTTISDCVWTDVIVRIGVKQSSKALDCADVRHAICKAVPSNVHCSCEVSR